MEDLKKLLAAATPGPWAHASDKLAAGNIKAPDNAALIVAAVNALPELLERVKRYESALEKIANPNTQITEVDEKYDEPVTVALDMWHAREIARVALNQETGQ